MMTIFLRALVYSGDHDMIIPFTGTRSWVYGMGLPEDGQYKAWMMGGQVAGFYASFAPGLTFATVKGAGHMAPQTNPRESLELISRFLERKL
jgi:serine carboxypeptidase-like clade 1